MYYNTYHLTLEKTSSSLWTWALEGLKPPVTVQWWEKGYLISESLTPGVDECGS